MRQKRLGDSTIKQAEVTFLATEATNVFRKTPIFTEIQKMSILIDPK